MLSKPIFCVDAVPGVALSDEVGGETDNAAVGAGGAGAWAEAGVGLKALENTKETAPKAAANLTPTAFSRHLIVLRVD